MIEPAAIQIRFSDIDVMGHVNNAVYLSYLEYTRVHYFKQILSESWDWTTNGIILAHTEVSYLSPILLNDQPMIHMKIGKTGNKSFTLHYTILVEGKIMSKASSTLVCYNTHLRKSIPIPLLMKESFLHLKTFQA